MREIKDFDELPVWVKNAYNDEAYQFAIIEAYNAGLRDGAKRERELFECATVLAKAFVAERSGRLGGQQLSVDDMEQIRVLGGEACDKLSTLNAYNAGEQPAETPAPAAEPPKSLLADIASCLRRQYESHESIRELMASGPSRTGIDNTMEQAAKFAHEAKTMLARVNDAMVETPAPAAELWKVWDTEKNQAVSVAGYFSEQTCLYAIINYLRRHIKGGRPDCDATVLWPKRVDAETPAPQPTEKQLVTKPSAGDWPEDFSDENGTYGNFCCVCGLHFNGHKRRTVCKVCASAHQTYNAKVVEAVEKLAGKQPTEQAMEIDPLWFQDILTLVDRAKKTTNLFEANADLALSITLLIAELRKRGES